MITNLKGIKPEKNPAIIDTFSWDKAKLVSEINENKNEIFNRLSCGKSSSSGRDDKKITILGNNGQGDSLGLYNCNDGQKAYFSVSGNTANPIDGRFHQISDDNRQINFIDCEYSTTAEILKDLDDNIHSVALGYTPRLGIGSRMTAFSWKPAIDAIGKMKFGSNLIQNSVREVRVFEELNQGEESRDVYLYSFGTIKEGHTGSTFEGLWLSGTVEAMLMENRVPYGSDADHIKIDNLNESLERAKFIIKCCKNYSFFTIDTSGVVKFDAEPCSSDPKKVGNVFEFHHDEIINRKFGIDLNRGFVEAMLNKYEDSLAAMKLLDDYLFEIKGKGNYDLEWSLDEIPAGIDVEANITTVEELLFLLLEVKRREINLTHIAPNFGVEKGVDYRMKSGRDYLYELIRSLKRISDDFGIILDVHSGDNLSTETKRKINEASGGDIHYKISPITQEIFAETLFKTSYEDFLFWWKEAFEYAKKQAEDGSEFARKCLREYEGNANKPSPADPVFHYYHYPPVGECKKDGNLYLREYLYSLGDEVYQEYDRSFNEYLISTAEAIFS